MSTRAASGPRLPELLFSVFCRIIPTCFSGSYRESVNSGVDVMPRPEPPDASGPDSAALRAPDGVTDAAAEPSTDLRRLVMRGGAFLAARQVIGMVISTAGMLILTWQIGPANYGLFIATVGVFAYFNYVAQCGLDVYLIRREGPTDDRDYHLAFTLLLGLGTIVAAVAFAAAPLLAMWADAPGITPLARAMFAGLPLGLLGLVAAARMERALDYRRLAMIELTNVFAMQSVSVSAAFAGAGAWSPIIGWWAQQLLGIVLLYALSGYRPRIGWEAARARTMLGYGISYAAAMWIWQLRSLINSLIVLPWAGPAAVGYVGIASKFVEVLSFVKSTTWRLSMVALARLNGDLTRAANAINEGMRLQILALGPLLAGFAVFAPYVLPVAFRSRWHEWSGSLDIYPYIAAGVIVNALFSLHSSVLFVLRRNAQVAIFHAVHVALLFAAAAWFVPRFGIIGVGYAELVAMASYVLIHVFTVRVLGRSPDYTVPAVWAVAVGLLLFVHQIGWVAWLGVVAVALWPKTWQTLGGYLHLLRPARAQTNGPDENGPLVSIVINNFNYARFLRQAIDSALAQTYANIEVVVVDDGSTDESRQIIASYGDRIRAVLKENGGQASAFNAGFAACRGELIALLDSDDTFLAEKVERCVAAARRHPNAQLIYHRVQTVDAWGTPSGKPTPPRVYRGSISRRVRRGGGTWYYAPTSGQVFRRAFFERVLPVPEELYRTSADAYVACLVGMLAPVAGIDDVLTCYRVHGANAWAAGGGASELQKLNHYVHRYELENGGLNEALARLDSPLRARTSDNFAYQLCLARLGRGPSLARLAWLAVRDPSETVLRVKMLLANLSELLRTRPQPQGATS
jgi:PST family polysaccharide transporter